MTWQSMGLAIAGIFTAIAGFFGGGSPLGFSVYLPYQGGTGTGTAPSTGGKLLISTSGGVYTPAYLTAGSNITIASSSGGITIASTATGGGGSFDGLDIANSGGTFFSIASLQFDAGHFTFSNTASSGYVRLDWGAGGPASLSEAETIAGNWVNTANPWADNEVADDITASNYQTLDATLTAWAAYNTSGLLTQTAADTFTGRTLTGTANQITVTNGDGVAGNPTLSIPSLFSITAASLSGAFEVSNTASISKFSLTDSATGVGMVDCDGDTQALGWDATSQRFFCGDDDSGGGAGVASDGLDFDEFRDAMTLDANTTVASAGFSLNFAGGGLGVKYGGTLNTPFEVGGIASISKVYVGNGSEALPTITFSSDTNTGLYRPVADTIYLTLGATETIRFTGAGIYSSQPIQNLGGAGSYYLRSSDSTAAGPAFSFSSDTDTGMYRIAANTLGFTTAGVQRASVSASRWEFNTGASVSGTFFLPGISAATGTPNSLCQNGSEVTVNAALTCTVSARDQKTNIKGFFDSGLLGGSNNEPALSLINKLNPTQFAYIDHPERMRWGFIADEVQTVDPKLGDGYVGGEARSIDIAGILALNTKAIQELQAENDLLKARLNSLENRVAKLDGKTPPVGVATEESFWQRIINLLRAIFNG